MTETERNILRLLAEAAVTPQETTAASLQAADDLRAELRTALLHWGIELDLMEESVDLQPQVGVASGVIGDNGLS